MIETDILAAARKEVEDIIAIDGELLPIRSLMVMAFCRGRSFGYGEAVETEKRLFGYLGESNT